MPQAAKPAARRRPHRSLGSSRRPSARPPAGQRAGALDAGAEQLDLHGERRVLAPDGTVLTLANLPPPDAPRWVASRKAVVVATVRGGLLSMSDACARYRLTTEACGRLCCFRRALVNDPRQI